MVELASDFLDRSTPIFKDDVAFFISQSGLEKREGGREGGVVGIREGSLVSTTPFIIGCMLLDLGWRREWPGMKRWEGREERKKWEGMMGGIYE